jgi:hypothetical protein
MLYYFIMFLRICEVPGSKLNRVTVLRLGELFSWPQHKLCYCTHRETTRNITFIISNIRFMQLLTIRKGKVKREVVPLLELSTTPWRCIGEWRYSSTQSLILALDGWEWSASRPRPFYRPRERDPGTHWIEVWVGPRTGLDAVVKIKIPSPCRESSLRSSSP